MASIRKREKKDGSYSYQVRFSIDTKQYSLTYDGEHVNDWTNWTERKREKEVQRWAALKEQEIKNGLATGKKAVKRFKDYSEELLERDVELGKLKLQSATNYRKLLQQNAYPVIGNKKLQDVTPEMLTKLFLKMSRDGYSTGTIRLTRACVSRVFTSAVKNGYIHYNPLQRAEMAKGVPHVHEKRKLTVDEIQQLIKACEEEPIVNRACVLTLIYTGCRKGEALGMRWKDVDLQTGVWTISNNLTSSEGKAVISTPKTGNRQIVMPAELVTVLKEWRTEQFSRFGIDLERYVLSDGIKPFMHPYYVQLIINRLVNLTGIERFTPHELRHSFISNLVDGGENFKAIADYVGNSPEMVMNVYSHTNVSDMERISTGIYSELKAVK